jgi:hypothetical protein
MQLHNVFPWCRSRGRSISTELGATTRCAPSKPLLSQAQMPASHSLYMGIWASRITELPSHLGKLHILRVDCPSACMLSSCIPALHDHVQNKCASSASSSHPAFTVRMRICYVFVADAGRKTLQRM